MNRISFLNRGYAFKDLLAVFKVLFVAWTCFPDAVCLKAKPITFYD